MRVDKIDLSVMHELGGLLEIHVRKEERIIFEMNQKELPDDVLVELAPYLY